MNASTRTRKVVSFLSSLTACLGLAVGAAGCFVQGSVSTWDPPVVRGAEPPSVTITEVPIETNATMSVFPGEGVGLYVEYASGGHWTVLTTCDTAFSGVSCGFDIILRVDPNVMLSAVQGFGLALGDDVTLGSDGTIQLLAETAYGIHGLSFDADPGAAVQVDMLLDGVEQPQFVYAVSDGILIEGVPTNPVDFLPSSL